MGCQRCAGMAPVLAATLALALVAVLAPAASATELTFDMPPNDEECFFEEISKGTEVTLEFQVVYGGRLDVDVEIKLHDEMVYAEQRAQSGSHTFTAKQGGEYSFCFSNEFSTVAHKTVYIDVIVGEEEPLLQDMAGQHTALTQMETSLVSMHESLKTVIDYQTHHRMREATHRKTAEFMNGRVQWVSAGEAAMLVVLSLFQVVYLRSLFTDKPPQKF